MIELRDAERVYIDANVLIYLVENVADWGERAQAVILAIIAAKGELFTSELSIGECLFRPHRDRNTRLIKLYEDFFKGEHLCKTPVSAKIIRDAAALAATTRLNLMDAIHIASAVGADCGAFVTNDMRIRSIPDVRILQLANVDT